MSRFVIVDNLRDYQKCPAFCKYNWTTESPKKKLFPTQALIQKCFKEWSETSSKPSWESIRKVLMNFVVKALPQSSGEEVIEAHNQFSSSIKTWYTNSFLKLPGQCVHKVPLSCSVNNLEFNFVVDAIISDGPNKTLIEFSNLSNEDLLKDIGLFAKIHVLFEQGIKINNIIIIKPNLLTLQTYSYKIHNPEDFYKRYKSTIEMFFKGIKDRTFYPSPSEKCKTCSYQSICTW